MHKNTTKPAFLGLSNLSYTSHAVDIPKSCKPTWTSKQSGSRL